MTDPVTMLEAVAAVTEVASAPEVRERVGHGAPIVPDRFWRALAAAVVIHLSAFWIAAGGPEALFDALFPPPAGSQAQQKQAGDEKGKVDGISAEVIDAEEFDKKYVSFKAGKDQADAETPPPQQAALPPRKPEEQKIEPEDRKLETAMLPVPPPAKSQKPAPKQQDETAFTADEINQIVTNSVEDIQGVFSIARAGDAKLGTSSPYVRAVIRKLKETMPKNPGARGMVIVQFAIGDDGSVAQARIARSSGTEKLDRIVIERVLSTRFAPPASSTTMQERVFQINYDYL